MTEGPAGTGTAYAPWIARVGAAILDSIPTALVFGFLTAAFGDNNVGGGSATFSLSGGPAVVYFLFSIAWLVYNVGMRQGRTGQSIGKQIIGISVFKAGTTEPLGLGLSIGRQFLHILDALPCLLGFLWPLWDNEKRTFADMLAESRVYSA